MRWLTGYQFLESMVQFFFLGHGPSEPLSLTTKCHVDFSPNRDCTWCGVIQGRGPPIVLVPSPAPTQSKQRSTDPGKQQPPNPLPIPLLLVAVPSRRVPIHRHRRVAHEVPHLLHPARQAPRPPSCGQGIARSLGWRAQPHGATSQIRPWSPGHDLKHLRWASDAVSNRIPAAHKTAPARTAGGRWVPVAMVKGEEGGGVGNGAGGGPEEEQRVDAIDEPVEGVDGARCRRMQRAGQGICLSEARADIDTRMRRGSGRGMVVKEQEEKRTGIRVGGRPEAGIGVRARLASSAVPYPDGLGRRNWYFRMGSAARRPTKVRMPARLVW